MASSRRKITRGMVLLYAVTVFAVIASIGLTILDSGEAFVGTVNTDVHALVAQQAALSGLAYGEAAIQQMLNLASVGSYPGTVQGRACVPVPAWCGRQPTAGSPYVYVPLQGAKGAIGSSSDPTGFPLTPIQANQESMNYTFTHDVRGGTETERALFRIELRECSRPFSGPGPLVVPAGNAGCGGFLYDENLLRQDFFFSSGSPYKPPTNPQAFGLVSPPDTYFMYTMRVEGEALALNPTTGAFVTMAHVVVKEPFTFKTDTPRRLFAQAFWYQDLQLGY